MINCSRCNSSGHIVATHRTSGCIFAFLCTCDIPRRRALKGPEWNERIHIKEYKPDWERDGVAKPPVITSLKPVVEAVEPSKKDYKVLASDPHYYDDEDIPF